MNVERYNHDRGRRSPGDSTRGEAPYRILLGEDDHEMRKLLAWSLQLKGYEVVECQDGDQLMKHLGLSRPHGNAQDQTGRFDLVISDVRMPGVTGLHVLESARLFKEVPPIILITAFPDQSVLDRAERLGAVATLEKPFEIDALLACVSRIRPAARDGSVNRCPLIEDEEGERNVLFPLEITFRHDTGMEPVKAFVRAMATKLNCFSGRIIHCRVVIDAPAAGDGAHHSEITIDLGIRGKTIVVRHSSDDEKASEDLYLATRIAFGAAFRKLKHLLERNARKRERSRTRGAPDRTEIQQTTETFFKGELK